jgi:hypothetical protein
MDHTTAVDAVAVANMICTFYAAPDFIFAGVQHRDSMRTWWGAER